MLGTFVSSQKGTNLLRDPDGYRYRTYRTISDGTVTSMRCVKQRTPTKCAAVAYMLNGTDPPEILRITNQHNHGVEVLTTEVRKVEQNTIKRFIFAENLCKILN